jgi:hypothetical protein
MASRNFCCDFAEEHGEVRLVSSAAELEVALCE